MMDYNIKPYGHRAWLIQFTDQTPQVGPKPQTRKFSKLLCLNILKLADHFRHNNSYWQEIVPAYDSLLLKTGHDLTPQQAQDHIADIIDGFTPQDKARPAKTLIDIPVHYGGEDGPDLERVSESCGLSPQAVIERHSAQPYLVCMLGFIPGFAFLSETDPAIHIARRADPRQHVRAGSVGLAGWQTGIYGLDSPGGWQIIGRTPHILFDSKRASPFLLKAGDWIRFVPENIKGAR